MWICVAFYQIQFPFTHTPIPIILQLFQTLALLNCCSFLHHITSALTQAIILDSPILSPYLTHVVVSPSDCFLPFFLLFNTNNNSTTTLFAQLGKLFVFGDGFFLKYLSPFTSK